MLAQCRDLVTVSALVSLALPWARPTVIESRYSHTRIIPFISLVIATLACIGHVRGHVGRGGQSADVTAPPVIYAHPGIDLIIIGYSSQSTTGFACIAVDHDLYENPGQERCPSSWCKVGKQHSKRRSTVLA